MTTVLPPTRPQPTSSDFIAGGGEMGELIRNFDWAATPVGPPETWPQSLRVTVRLMLNSRHPMFIWWGEDLIQFYNDAYRQTMGPEMHPSALGAGGRDSWADIWPIIGPQIEMVMSGQGSTWNVEQMVPIRRHGRVEDVWWTYGYSPIDLDDGVGGVLVVCNDVTERHLQTESLRTRTQRLAKQFEEAPGFIAVLTGPEHVFELANASYRRLIGGRDVVGKPVRESLPEIAGQGFFELLDQVHASGKPYIGRRSPLLLQTEPGEAPKQVYLDFIYQPIVEGDGKVSGIFVQGQDVTDHVRNEERLTLINSELRHRVKNTLAMVGAVANQTFRGGTTIEDALEAFNARLVAFGSAHDALSGDRDAIGRVEEVVNGALAPHLPGPDRFRISGDDVFIGSKQALSLALAMHEMATNAAKYGALSSAEGRVDLRWWAENKIFRLEWCESGGPAVTPPTKKGFGSRLIKSVLAADFGGEVELRYEPDGVVLTITAPLRSLLPVE